MSTSWSRLSVDDTTPVVVVMNKSVRGMERLIATMQAIDPTEFLIFEEI